MLELYKIRIKELPGIYPNYSYVDTIYSTNRPIKIGFHEESFTTDKKFKTTNDTWYNNRKIQTILYDKYSINIPAKENQRIGLLKYGDFIEIEFPTGSTHECLILAVNEQYVGDSFAIMYTIEYADINPQNYTNLEQPVINYLKHENIENAGVYGTLAAAYLNNGSGTTKIYTRLLPEFDVSEYDVKEEKVNSINVTSYVAYQGTLKARFYIGQTNANLIKDLLRFSSGYNSGYLKIVYGYTYQSIELVKPDISQIVGAVDLYEWNLEIKYNNTQVNLFES